jgi:hypothetical protein
MKPNNLKVIADKPPTKEKENKTVIKTIKAEDTKK